MIPAVPGESGRFVPPPSEVTTDACSWTREVVDALELLGDPRAVDVAKIHTRLLLQADIAGVLHLSETDQRALVADTVVEVSDLLREAATDRARHAD